MATLAWASAVKGRQASLAILSPQSWAKCPASGCSSGTGQPAICRRNATITGGPKTGSFIPAAMKTGPRQWRPSQSRAAREIAAPGASGRSGKISGKRRAPAL